MAETKEKGAKKARKQPTAAEQARANEQRNATQAANASMVVDYGAPKSANDLATEKAQVRGMWVAKLADLRTACEDPASPAETGSFYKIGAFGNAIGARNVIKGLEEKDDALPGAFDLQPRIVRVERDGKNVKTSELWAAFLGEDDEDGDEEG